MYGLVIVHEDGCILSTTVQDKLEARSRFADAALTSYVVYAHFSDPDYKRICSYTREKP